MNIEVCTDFAEWDAYVASQPAASNYHRSPWKNAIESTFGHRSFYLAARGCSGIEGVLPLFSIRSYLFGHSLVSMPFFSFGGVVASSGEARDRLLEAAIGLAGKIGASRIELRQGGDLGGRWQPESLRVDMVAPLAAQPDQMWKRLTTGLRNKIRYAEKHGLKPEWGGGELAAQFYSVFAVNMRNLGTPVYPRAWFENLCRCCPEIRILLLRDGAAPVAAAFLVPYRDVLELPWSASLPASRKKYSQVFLYWNFLAWAIENGYRYVDLGRCTPGGGTYEFKRHWGCEEKTLRWCYWLAEGAGLPARAENAGFRLPIEIWKRLPLAVANTVGPRIVRSLP